MNRAAPPEPDATADGAELSSATGRWLLLATLLCLALGFAALGAWQLQRMGWKHDLIERVNARVAAAPVAAPGPDRWAAITAGDYEYLRVALEGTFLHNNEALVTASTERGPGYWVMTPLRQGDGTIIIVNRGFVPPGLRDPASRLAGQTTGPVSVIGLLRLSEAGQWILRQNDPAAGRWYRRDPEQVGSAGGLQRVAPFFVDAEAPAGAPEWPAAGMTRIRFADNHLVYALTWFTLALLAAFGAGYIVQTEFGTRRG